MSYYAKICFKRMEPDEIIAFFKLFKKKCVEEMPEIAKADYIYCPAIMKHFDFSLAELVNDELEKHRCINWVKDCFRFKYFYDEEFGLLGMFNVPDCLNGLFDACITFQNSCDQDYEQNAWSGIKEFEDIYAKWITKDDDEVRKSYNAQFKFCDFDKDFPEPIKKAEQLMYYRRSFAYQEIWKRYESELWDEDDAIHLSLFGGYELGELYKFLKLCFTEAQTERMEFQNNH